MPGWSCGPRDGAAAARHGARHAKPRSALQPGSAPCSCQRTCRWLFTCSRLRPGTAMSSWMRLGVACSAPPAGGTAVGEQQGEGGRAGGMKPRRVRGAELQPGMPAMQAGGTCPAAGRWPACKKACSGAPSCLTASTKRAWSAADQRSRFLPPTKGARQQGRLIGPAAQNQPAWQQTAKLVRWGPACASRGACMHAPSKAVRCRTGRGRHLALTQCVCRLLRVWCDWLRGTWHNGQIAWVRLPLLLPACCHGVARRQDGLAGCIVGGRRHKR